MVVTRSWTTFFLRFFFLHLSISDFDESSSQPVGRSVTWLFLVREVWRSNLKPVKLDIVLPTARHCCDISSKRSFIALSGAMTRRWAPQACYMLWRNTANIMKDLIGLDYEKKEWLALKNRKMTVKKKSNVRHYDMEQHWQQLAQQESSGFCFKGVFSVGAAWVATYLFSE